jgi:hypothetical protein
MARRDTGFVPPLDQAENSGRLQMPRSTVYGTSQNAVKTQIWIDS